MINKLSWTMHPESTALQQLTYNKNGLMYIVGGYTRHATDDRGKLKDMEEFIAKMQGVEL